MLGRAVAVVLLLSAGVANADDTDEDEDLSDMSLEQLLGVEVTTASNMRESLSRAPGVVIRLSREDLEARGYHELLELFDDLPGMDVVRPWGDNYLKVYWRGYRTDTTHPFLVMVDGMVVNSLWSGDASIASALPISEVDHVEIVYGPVSAVYGANAFMGVVNVFTLSGVAGLDGAPRARLRITGGGYGFDHVDRRTLDGVVTHRAGELEVVLGGRLALGWTDDDAAERFEYTSDRYASDPALWGGYLGFENLANGTRSPIEQYGIDARARLGGLEVGAMALTLDTGYGLVYATDLVQPYAHWVQYERSAHASYTAALDGDGDVTSRTLVRVRDGGIDNRSYFLSAFNQAPQGTRVLELSYWQARNQSIAASQSVEAKLSERLSLVAGGDLERKNLHGAYDVNAGPLLAPGQVDADVMLPSPPNDAARDVERPRMDSVGVYAQARYRREHVLADGDAHALHAGIRFDHNSVFGRAHSPTLRVGYVGELDGGNGLFVGKLLYGEGFHEPNPRQLYGGWLGSGSDPALVPEASRTVELNISHTTERLSNLVSAYYVNNYDTIVQFAGGAANKGKRTVIGVDYHLRALFRAPHVDSVSLWAYYSYIWSEELTFDSADNEVEAPIGDLAAHKAWLGGTARRGPYHATVRGRIVADRETVATNPVREIGGYAVFDLTVGVDAIAGEPVKARLRVDNLVGTEYSHPGIRTADSGEVPGSGFAGSWTGAAGYYNSRLPQPGRAVWLTLGLDL
jgi:outer membrane receptor for ferrienterochelin and colicins